MGTTMNRHTKTTLAKSLFCVLLGLLVLAGPSVSANEMDPNNTDDLFEMSLEELTEIPVIISASRQPQNIAELSVPVSVVTAEDIHYSGLTSIPEILQYYAGMDVLRIDRNYYAVGVRGLHDYISDRTLTLINGRNADSPLFGGSEFFRLPVMVEDIERIEIVRGPGGAAWGANAFTGVINIITKKPTDEPKSLISTTVNEYGDSYSHLRLAQKDGKWAWRASVGYEEKENSDDAGAGRYQSTATPTINTLIGYSDFEVQDFSRSYRVDTEAMYSYSDQTSLSFGVGYSHDELGNFEFGGYFPDKDSLFETTRSFVRIDHTFDDDSTGYVQWYNNIARSWIPSVVEWNNMENDIEAQYNFSPAENHSMSIGGNVRFVRLDTEVHDPLDIRFHNTPCNEYLAGLFFIDRWELTERLTLEGQIRGDCYSETQQDWSTRLSALYGLDEQKNHNLRFSFAKAFRSPLSTLRETSFSRIPLGMGLHSYYLIHPEEDLENEETWSLEGAYTGKLGAGLVLKANIYYQRFEKMIGYNRLPDPMGMGRLFAQANNIDGADSYGAELEIEKSTEWGKVSAWYAYNDFHTDQLDQDMRSYTPAEHKVGMTGRLFLEEGWTLNANYRYTDTTSNLSGFLTRIESSHRLDLTVSKAFADNRGEIMIGVSDILNETNGPIHRLAGFTTHETPGRTFFARVQYNF